VYSSLYIIPFKVFFFIVTQTVEQFVNVLLTGTKKEVFRQKTEQKILEFLLTNRYSCAKIVGCAKKWRFLMQKDRKGTLWNSQF
jgi:hypothetical protein